MTPKESAIRAIQGLPDHCTWNDVLQEVAERVPSALASERPLAREAGGASADEPALDYVQEGGMSRTYDVVVQRDEDGYYVGSVPELPGCHTQAKTLEQLLERIREAIELCLEVADPERAQFIGIRRVTVPA